MRSIAKLGGMVWGQWDDLRYAAAVIGTVLASSVQPRSWGRAVWSLFARQVLILGVKPVLFVSGVAVFAGIPVVVQLSFWTGKAGQSELLGPLLVTVVAREMGPVLINLIVIVRSGSAMTIELGILKIEGGVRALQARGRDPFLHLIMPRVLGMAVATFCLTIVFIFAAFASGYFFAALMGKGSRDFLLFADTVSRAVQLNDIFNVLVKSILPALFASASCCIGGLSVGESFKEIPEVTQRALTRSLTGLFVISAVTSVLTYL